MLELYRARAICLAHCKAVPEISCNTTSAGLLPSPYLLPASIAILSHPSHRPKVVTVHLLNHFGHKSLLVRWMRKTGNGGWQQIRYWPQPFEIDVVTELRRSRASRQRLIARDIMRQFYMQPVCRADTARGTHFCKLRHLVAG